MSTEAFTVAFKRFESDNAAFWQSAAALDSEFKASTESFWKGHCKALQKRKAFDWAMVAMVPGFAAIRASFESRANSMTAANKAREESAKAELVALALAVNPIPTSAELELHDISYCSNYSTQGYGAIKYTEQHAQQLADKAMFYGLKAEVRTHGDYRPARGIFGCAAQDYAVWANCDSIGWEILRLKPEVPLRDWLKACWSRGVNPRVYNPFLPHGLEEKMGVDFHGRDIPKFRSHQDEIDSAVAESKD